MSLGAVSVSRINSMAFVVQTATAFFMALSTFSNYRTRAVRVTHRLFIMYSDDGGETISPASFGEAT